jgi:peptidyl-prolyl cis-trans isomerase A (cyclophilin A)
MQPASTGGLSVLILVASLLGPGCPRKDVARDDVEPTPDAQGAPTHDEPTGQVRDVPADERALKRATEGLEGSGALYATLHTSEGDLECQLYPEKATFTVANFVGLARGTREWIDPDGDQPVTRPLYRDLRFHRIVPGFIVQTGDPTGTGEGGPGYQFDDEFDPDLRHDAAGTLSMANHGPNTNGSQFFVTLAPAPHLDGRHTVFGHCKDGPVLQALGAERTDGADPPTLRSIEISYQASADAP